MKKLLQIDSCLNMLSTGRITESIGRVANEKGWETYIVHGARYIRNGSCMQSIQTSSKIDEYLHFAEGLLMDNHGLASRKSTKRVIEQIKTIKPDIIQLHCIHGYYLNYELLFEYFKSVNIPVVWTFHDCWAFTGHCAYFDKVNCNKWETGCQSPCPAKRHYPKSILLDRSEQNYKLKQQLFTSIGNRLAIVPVSFWLEDFVRKSFLRNVNIQTIHNGTDINVFRPFENSILRNKLGLEDKKVILGVASPWSARKGLQDMVKLAKQLNQEQYCVILIGLSEKQKKVLPPYIIGINRTNDAKELAEYYSLASVFVNPTYEDNFPTTNIEALACGTPVITYKTGGSPEAVDDQTGRVIEQGDIHGICDAIYELTQDTCEMGKKCRERAENLYDANNVFKKYINLYEDILNNNA